MHENDISMHENENRARGTIFSPKKFSWVVGLYTTALMECSPMQLLGNFFYFMHEIACIEIFMPQFFHA